MLPAFLITLREVIEASFIVAAVAGVLLKLKQDSALKTVWAATAAAVFMSILLIAGASAAGFKMQEIYSGKTEEFTEGLLMIVSAVFITWAVFFLHNYFSRNKEHMQEKVRKSMEQKGLFALVFIAVFREGFEIVLFLSTVYFSSSPREIFAGFAGGVAGGLLVSFAFFSLSLRMPVHYAFKTTSILLILFAAGLVARGVHEFAEAGFVPELMKLTIPLLPQKGTFAADMIKTLFGVTRNMDIVQIVFYILYTAFMGWHVFVKQRRITGV